MTRNGVDRLAPIAQDVATFIEKNANFGTVELLARSLPATQMPRSKLPLQGSLYSLFCHAARMILKISRKLCSRQGNHKTLLFEWHQCYETVLLLRNHNMLSIINTTMIAIVVDKRDDLSWPETSEAGATAEEHASGVVPRVTQK